MTRSSKRIAWKQDKVFSLKLRNGHYSLLQMLTPGVIAVYSHFQDNDDWNVQLAGKDVLFIGVVLKSVFARSVVTIHDGVKPVIGLKCPEVQIDIGDGFRTVTVWENSEDERKFLMMGNLCNKVCHIRRINGQVHEEYTDISLKDYDKYKELELTNLYDYPSFNERLYLCEFFGSNVDPLKEIAFDRPLPREYRTYIDIIEGKIRLSELGY